jgi:hypothetical protein
MKNNKKIGWQKYEDFIEKQLTSPILTNILQNIAAPNLHADEDEDDDEEDDEDTYIDESDDDKNLKIISPLLPITNQLIDDITMLSTFDCWIGHTNFDVTPTIKNILNKVPGVEVLKICSRYRFFIGIGKMFDFKDVRQYIEDSLLEEGD